MSCPFGVPDHLHGAGMPQTFREGTECVKTDVSEGRIQLGTFQTMFMFHGFLDVPKGKDSQRIGQVKVGTTVRPQRGTTTGQERS